MVQTPEHINQDQGFDSRFRQVGNEGAHTSSTKGHNNVTLQKGSGHISNTNGNENLANQIGYTNRQSTLFDSNQTIQEGKTNSSGTSGHDNFTGQKGDKNSSYTLGNENYTLAGGNLNEHYALNNSTKAEVAGKKIKTRLSWFGGEVKEIPNHFQIFWTEIKLWVEKMTFRNTG
ncbi:hypothetical protein E0Z10_g5746 [Xylaria hypoxylon]|uniref:Uncharacterized protein n=1 Tax=Xylaria hypoxylon TaxID=37992 RepID=A0A4Z0YV36_9PEZI|nr:hypothetical protein E0Z10_g5746 [Xylaria hypoxylon]